MNYDEFLEKRNLNSLSSLSSRDNSSTLSTGGVVQEEVTKTTKLFISSIEPNKYITNGGYNKLTNDSKEILDKLLVIDKMLNESELEELVEKIYNEVFLKELVLLGELETTPTEKVKYECNDVCIYLSSIPLFEKLRDKFNSVSKAVNTPLYSSITVETIHDDGSPGYISSLNFLGFYKYI